MEDFINIDDEQVRSEVVTDEDIMACVHQKQELEYSDDDTAEILYFVYP